MRIMLAQGLFSVCLIGLLPLEASPQQSRVSGPRVGVTLAVMDREPMQGEPVVLLRRADASDGSFSDVLVIARSHLGPIVLSRAIRDIIGVRSWQGDYAMSNQTLRVRSGRGRPNEAGAARVFPWVPRVLKDLKDNGEQRVIEGIGKVTAIDIYLPASRQ